MSIAKTERATLLVIIQTRTTTVSTAFVTPLNDTAIEEDANIDTVRYVLYNGVKYIYGGVQYGQIPRI